MSKRDLFCIQICLRCQNTRNNYASGVYRDGERERERVRERERERSREREREWER